MLGDQLRKSGTSDLELRTATIRGVLSASQCCILMELVLRYMDILRIDGKRWFYRPVMARVLGHLGAANEKEEGATVAPAATVTTAATGTGTATATPVIAPAKRVIPKGKKPAAVVVTKVEPVSEEKTNTVIVPYTAADLKKLSKQELSRLTNDEISEDVSRAEYARIFAAAPEEPSINKTVLAPVSTKAPSQKVVVTKANED
jgi:hypothetical protein